MNDETLDNDSARNNAASKVQTLSQSPTDYQRVPDLTRITEQANIPTDAFMLLSSTSTDYAVQFSLLMDLVMPVGACVPWHTETPPAGWAIYDGSQFDVDANPKNALVFPSGRFPDYSGRVPEGYIDDTNGAVGSMQSGGVKSHGHSATTTSSQASHSHTRGSMEIKGTLPAQASGEETTDWSGAFYNNFKTGDGGDDGGGNTWNTGFAASRSWSGSTSSIAPAITSTTTISSTGSSRNTVDRVVCYWIGRLG